MMKRPPQRRRTEAEKAAAMDAAAVSIEAVLNPTRTTKRRNPADSVVTVGAGRGFIVTAHTVRLAQDPKTGKWASFKRPQSLIVTAAHCLPHFPPCHGASYTVERTYPNLIGPLGEAPTVWGECLFAYPIADIAVLDGPDGQDLFQECPTTT